MTGSENHIHVIIIIWLCSHIRV